eukprot:2373959-Rhodomonas_salina.2
MCLDERFSPSTGESVKSTTVSSVCGGGVSAISIGSASGGSVVRAEAPSAAGGARSTSGLRGGRWSGSSSEPSDQTMYANQSRRVGISVWTALASRSSAMHMISISKNIPQLVPDC